jgi:uncharacterized protein DUF6941
MPYPPIRHCLICEEVRPEMGGKSTLLGFYGIAPDVNLVVPDIAKPIERISFLLVSDVGPGKYRITLRIEAPNGEVLLSPPEAEFEVPGQLQPARFMNTVLAVNSIQFKGTGRHKFKLLVGGKEHFETSFDVTSSAKP